MQAPSIKSMKEHFDARHAKLAWEPEKFVDMHALNGGVTVAGVAVAGTQKKKNKRDKAMAEKRKIRRVKTT